MFCQILILVLFKAVTCQFLEKGECPDDSRVITNFNVRAYLGLWYELERYEQLFELNGDCVTAEYILQSDNSVKVINSMLNLQSKRVAKIEGRAVLSYPEQPPVRGSLNVTFAFGPNVANYKIIDTDYQTYSLVWNCVTLRGPQRIEAFWILSRERKLSPYPQKLQNLIKQYAKQDKLRKTIQGDECKQRPSDF